MYRHAIFIAELAAQAGLPQQKVTKKHFGKLIIPQHAVLPLFEELKNIIRMHTVTHSFWPDYYHYSIGKPLQIAFLFHQAEHF